MRETAADSPVGAMNQPNMVTSGDGYVVLGGGVGGLVAGLLLKRRDAGADVTILEGSESLGGAMRGCSRMGEIFDLGTHIPQQTGIPEVDSLVEASVQPDDLIRMPSSVGDFAGTFHGDSVRLDTPYLDLLHADPVAAGSVVEHVVGGEVHSERRATGDPRSAPVGSVAEAWFGRGAAESFVMPLVGRLFGDRQLLSGFALELANLTRVRAADAGTWMAHSPSPWFRSRIAYPDQRSLPEQFRHSRKSLYARNGNSGTFVDGLLRQCIAEGIKIETECRVQRIDLARRLIDVALGGDRQSIGYDRLVSTLGPSVTAILLGEEAPQGAERIEYRLVHHVLRHVVRSEGCYFYDHDDRSPIFRVTNYGAFSGRSDDRRLTTEVLGRDEVPDDRLAALVERRLTAVGLVEEGGFLDRVVDRQGGGFPLPTVRTFEHFEKSARTVAVVEDDRFVVGGVGSSGTAFFQNEVIRDLHRRLARLS